MISVVVPTLDESPQIVATLSALRAMREAGHEIIVVDGGSRDGTPEAAEPLADRVLVASVGRALQMNAGAKEARGKTLLFLHADTRIPPSAIEALEEFHTTDRMWGWFDVRLSGSQFMLRVVESLMNVRSRMTGITTGDHAIFVRRGTFEKVGGFPEIPLMEDIAISRALKREGRPFVIGRRIVTSSRRWEDEGTWRTILLMWRLRLAYALGADPRELAKMYYREG
jgi:rSAM/selenodomain-associated transferase 2